MNFCFLLFVFKGTSSLQNCQEAVQSHVHFEVDTVFGRHNYFRSARIAIVFGCVISTSIFTVLISTVSNLAFHNLVKVSFVKTEAK